MTTEPPVLLLSAIGDGSSRAVNPAGGVYDNRLVLDSGASMHVVGDPSILQDFRPSYGAPRCLSLADNSQRRILGVGDIVELGRFRIPNVRLVEGLQKNLISVGQLDKEHHLCVQFYDQGCTIMKPDGITYVGGAVQDEVDKMYALTYLQVV